MLGYEVYSGHRSCKIRLEDRADLGSGVAEYIPIAADSFEKNFLAPQFFLTMTLPGALGMGSRALGAFVSLTAALRPP